jgi:hypothetical protein
MLTIAGVLFVLATLLFFIDKWIDDADINLAGPIRVLLIASLALIGLSYYF